MARFPGTETRSNRRGLRPGDAVRCRRSRANGALGLADARGLVVEVQPAHARVLFDVAGRSLWIEDAQLVTLPAHGLEGELALFGSVLAALRGERVEFEEGGLVVVASAALDADGLDRARALLGDRLAGLEIQPGGVHEIAIRLQLAPRGDR